MSHTNTIVAIDSSMFQAVSYDERAQTLLVLFNSGKAYRYSEVPKAIYVELLESSSKGRFMHDRILGKFPWQFAKKPTPRAASKKASIPVATDAAPAAPSIAPPIAPTAA